MIEPLPPAILYEYWRSSASYRLRIALHLLGLGYESIPVDLLSGEQRSADNLARNPQGLVPTLIVDGLTLSQSLAAIEYLNETREGHLLPKDAPGRARVRALSYAIAMDIHPICNLRVAQQADALSDGAILMENWMRAFITPGLQAFEVMLQSAGTGRFSHGDQVTLADICLVPQVFNARRWSVDLSSLPLISAICSRLDAEPAFARSVPTMNRLPL